MFLNNGTTLIPAGKLQDAEQFFIDLAAGYWLYESPEGRIAPSLPCSKSTTVVL